MVNSIQLIDITNRMNANLVYHLQQFSYLEESILIDYPKLPSLFESIEDLLTSKETFIGYYSENALLGVISYVINHEVLEIGRLIIHPNNFRQGFAKTLLKYIESIEPQTQLLRVNTAQKNLPAIKLYESQGYYLKNIEQLQDGLMIACFEKVI